MYPTVKSCNASQSYSGNLLALMNLSFVNTGIETFASYKIIRLKSSEVMNIFERFLKVNFPGYLESKKIEVIYNDIVQSSSPNL